MNSERMLNISDKQIPTHTAGAVIGNGTQAPRQREVPEALERLDAATDMLQQSLSYLGERLAPVLGPEMPQDPNKVASSTFSSLVAARVGSTVEDLRALGIYVQSLIARLEV